MTDTGTPATGTETIALLEGVERFYHMGDTTVRALNGIDLEIARGEYLAIMGRSGSGKSTMLNILGLLDRPTGGEYTLNGRRISQLNDTDLSQLRGQEIGFIFQSFNLIPQLTVLENLEVPLFYQNAIGPESKARAEELAIRVGLKGRLNHRPNELSGGQQQRVAIARALMNEPLYLLADEATGNLDSNTENEILALLDELHQDGMTIIMVTHNPDMCDRAQRVVHLADGKVDRVEVVHA